MTRLYRNSNHTEARGIVLFLILMLMVVCSTLLSQEITQRVPDLKWWNAMCQVNYDNKCITTGFFISKDGIVVTAFHLIRGGWIEIAEQKIWVKVYEGGEEKVFKADILMFQDKGLDILFLKIDYKPEFWFDEFADPEPDMNCVVLGYPYNWEIALKAKVIENKEFRILGISRVSFPGASGSAVLDYEGRVLGMVVKQYGYLAITHSHFIRMGLEKIQNEEKNEGTY